MIDLHPVKLFLFCHLQGSRGVDDFDGCAMAGVFKIAQDSDSPVVSPARSERSLTPKVPAELVQGVPCRCLLVGGGRPFRTSDKVESTRHLTRCSSYDIFVSHDWQTSRWLKYASLLVLLNSRAAALATLVVSLALGLLVAYEALPNYSWSVSIGYLTFAVFFFFWQHIRDIFLTPKLAFLDKLCIPQDNEEVKEKCILGLAGFLKHSQELVILFSESYIGRLWCIYEITAFMRTHSNQGHVQTVPVVLPLLILLHAAWWLAVRLLILLIWETSQTNSTMDVLAVILIGLAVTFLSTYPLQAWVGRRLTKNLQSLSRQLREFDIHESKCSCCSAGHETPSGERIPCDRDLIYQSLADWYGNDADELQGRLESFNKAVRTQFADRILTSWEEQSMPIKLFIYIVFSMNTPSLIIRIPDAIGQAQQQPSAFLACVVAMKVLIVRLGYMWAAMLFYLWACKTMWALTLQCNQWPISFVIEAGAAVFVLLSWGIVSAVCVFSVLLTHRHSWPPLLGFVVVMALGLYLLRVCNLPVKACRKNTVDETSTECGQCSQVIGDDDMSSFPSEQFSLDDIQYQLQPLLACILV